MSFTRKLSLLFIAVVVIGVFVVPGAWWNKIIAARYLLIAAVIILGAVGSALIAGIDRLYRWRNVRLSSLDSNLRRYVLSDASWENCAQAPSFAEAALMAYCFLVDEEGFQPAKMDRGWRSLLFRRGDVGVVVGDDWAEADVDASHEGVRLEAVARILLFRSAHSFVPLAEERFGSVSDHLGDGHRGVAFHVRSHLDESIASLRERTNE